MREKDRELLKQQVAFTPYGIVSREGYLSGLKLPDGSLILNMNEKTSAATLALYRDQLSAETIIVKGTWTFTPIDESVKSFKKPGELS